MCIARGPLRIRKCYYDWGALIVWKLAPGLLSIPGSKREWMSREQKSRKSFSRALFLGEEIEIIGKLGLLLR